MGKKKKESDPKTKSFSTKPTIHPNYKKILNPIYHALFL